MFSETTIQETVKPGSALKWHCLAVLNLYNRIIRLILHCGKGLLSLIVKKFNYTANLSAGKGCKTQFKVQNV